MSTVRPREYIKRDENGRTLSTVRCPFCHKKIDSESEPEFRDHLHKFCDEAPREVVYR